MINRAQQNWPTDVTRRYFVNVTFTDWTSAERRTWEVYVAAENANAATAHAYKLLAKQFGPRAVAVTADVTVDLARE